MRNTESTISSACTCPYGVASRRRSVRGQIAALTCGSSAAKRKIYEFMDNVRREYLPGTSAPEEFSCTWSASRESRGGLDGLGEPLAADPRMPSAA